jgi:hypothetical protein
MIGKIATQSISTINNPVIGVKITNRPTILRKYFGTYTYSNYTEPNWTVELYVNDVLTDYVKVDASGYFTFDIPLFYGNSDITLRYYGLWGEEQTFQKNLRIPHNFLPQNEFEYTVSSGIINGAGNNVFSQARVNYGLSHGITIGGGLEYLSSNSKNKYIPFFNTSISLSSNILFTQEYAYKVRYKGAIQYNLPNSFRFALNYAKYSKTQEAIMFNYDEELKAMISKPFKLNNNTIFSQLTFNHYNFQSKKYFNTEFLLSRSARGVKVSLTTFAFFTEKNKINLNPYSNLSVFLLLPKNIIFKSQIRYKYNQNKFISIQYGFEKHIFKHGYIKTSYELDLSNKVSYFNIGFKYDFSFAHISSSVNHNKNSTTFFQSSGGSLIYEPKTKFIDFNRIKNIGKGGIIFSPFLDINDNGKRDENEPKVNRLNVRVYGGGLKKNRKDTTIVILGLEPYKNYLVELNTNNFEYVAWKIKKPRLSIAINPNQLKLVEIPVAVVGEVAGMIYLKDKNEQNGIGRIKVSFYNNDSVLVASTLSETDGYFNFLGLSPGRYTAIIDSSQLHKLQMSATPTILLFNIQASKEGNVVDNLKFVLQKG